MLDFLYTKWRMSTTITLRKVLVIMDSQYKDNQFFITVEYEKLESNQEQIFLGIAKLIEGLQYADKQLVGCIAKDIEPVVLLDNIEQGSIKIFLRSVIESLPDEGLEKCDIKRIIGAFLVKAKYAILKATSQNEPIQTHQLDQLEKEIDAYAQDTGTSTLGCYTQVDRESIITSMARITDAVDTMRPSDRVKFEAEIGGSVQTISIPKELQVDDSVTDSLAKHEEINQNTFILKINKVDFMGNSKWEFRLGKSKITAHIEDEEWLKRYKTGKIVLVPGDSLKVLMEVKMQYGKGYDLICTLFKIIKVLDVIHTEEPIEENLF